MLPQAALKVREKSHAFSLRGPQHFLMQSFKAVET